VNVIVRWVVSQADDVRPLTANVGTPKLVGRTTYRYAVAAVIVRDCAREPPRSLERLATI
jgi:hypothetical protein